MISTLPPYILRDCLCFMCQISLWYRAKPVLLFNLIYTRVQQQQQQQQNLEWKWYIPIFPCESAPSAITCQSQYRITCFCFHFPYAPSFHIVNLSHLIHSIGSYLFFSVPHILFSFQYLLSECVVIVTISETQFSMLILFCCFVSYNQWLDF